jgi:hypothetical protein
VAATAQGNPELNLLRVPAALAHVELAALDLEEMAEMVQLAAV